MKAKAAAKGGMDAYIQRHPQSVRDALNVLRATIQAAAPQAEATIRYQIPTFQHHGNLGLSIKDRGRGLLVRLKVERPRTTEA